MPEILSEPPTYSSSRPALPGLPVGMRARRAPGLARTLALPRGPARLVVVAVLGLAVALLFALPLSYDVDSWLELVAGRDIWLHGLPHHETLTVLAHGVRWVDQQWLAQLASYLIYRVGGLGFLGLVNVGLIILGVAIVIGRAWSRGVRLSIMLITLLFGLFQLVPFREVRTQAFAFPLIAVVLVLLSQDSRTPSRRVYWCLPLLVLWANLHGTVSIGAALVALRGLTLAWERRAQLRPGQSLSSLWAQLRRPLALVVGAPASLLLTPYGLQNISYYRQTLGNSSLQHGVTEWQPITSHWGLALPFFIFVGLTIWSFGRCPDKTTAWEKITLLALALASIDVLRNDLMFAMAALLIVPASLNAAVPVRRKRNAPVRDRVNAVIAAVVIAITFVASAATLLRPASSFEHKTQRTAVLAAVNSALRANPSLNVLADVRYADWLLWRDPRLAGHIGSDARFEILSAQQMDQLQRVFGAVGPTWKQAARGYRLLVLDRSASPDTVAGFLAEPGRRILYRDSERIVILRSSKAA